PTQNKSMPNKNIRLIWIQVFFNFAYNRLHCIIMGVHPIIIKQMPDHSRLSIRNQIEVHTINMYRFKIIYQLSRKIELTLFIPGGSKRKSFGTVMVSAYCYHWSIELYIYFKKNFIQQFYSICRRYRAVI